MKWMKQAAAAGLCLLLALPLNGCKKSAKTAGKTAGQTTAATSTAAPPADVYASQRDVPLLKKDFTQKLESAGKYNSRGGTFTMTSGCARFYAEGKSEPLFDLLLADVKLVVTKEPTGGMVPVDFITTSGKTTVHLPEEFVKTMSGYVYLSKTELTLLKTT